MTLHATEEQVQAAIIEGLTALGYTVLQTSHRVKLAECPRCHSRFRPVGGYGSTPGVPDLLVSRTSWPVGCWLGLEVKGPKTAISPAQKGLLDAARIVIARSWEDALSHVQIFEQGIQGGANVGSTR